MSRDLGVPTVPAYTLHQTHPCDCEIGYTSLGNATKVHGPVHHVVDAAITSPTHEAANKVEDLTIVHLSRRDNLDGPSQLINAACQSRPSL
jgi:hypothetical protein